MQAVAVPARIHADNAVQVLESLREATAQAESPLALDLSALREFDSSALSLLLQLARERIGSASSAVSAHPAGGGQAADGAPARTEPLFLLNPPEKLQELAQLYGVAEMLFGAPSGPSGSARSN